MDIVYLVILELFDGDPDSNSKVCFFTNIQDVQYLNSIILCFVHMMFGLMSQVVGSNNSYKPITNTAWVRARLCKLQKGCTRLTDACDKVYQLLAYGRWFSPGTPASSTTKTGRHDIAEILLKVALNTKIQILQFSDEPNSLLCGH